MKLLKLKRERLREWMNQGFTVPSLMAKGVGTKAIFTVIDIYKIAVFKRLIEAGVNRRRAATWVNTNPKLNDPNDAEELNLIVLIEHANGGEWCSYMGDGPWKIEDDIKSLPPWDVGVIINFQAIREKVKREISTL